MQTEISDKANNLLSSWAVSVNADGTFAHKGAMVTPAGVQPEFDFAKAEAVIVDEKEEGKLYVGYRNGVVETFFEMVLEKNEQGEEVLYFYIP